MLKMKDKRLYRENPLHSYGVSLAIWDHTVLLATQQVKQEI